MATESSSGDAQGTESGQGAPSGQGVEIGQIDVGEDLAFQRRWWVFERVLWGFFLAILIADVLGVFGRGWAAKAKLVSSDDSMQVAYERVQRAGTPSTLTIRFGQGAIRNGHIGLYVSEDLIRPLGAQRISPEPLKSTLAPDGIVYEFPAEGAPATVEFQLESSFPGVHQFAIGLAGEPVLRARVMVLP
jgi:hypothetical protein